MGHVTSDWPAGVAPAAFIDSPLVPVAPEQWYRFGDGYLVIRSEHLPFRSRFERLFGTCRAAPDERIAAPVVRCDVAMRGEFSVIRFEDPKPLDVVAFAATLFADRGLREWPPGVFPGRAFGLESTAGPVVIGARGDTLVASNGQAWEWLIGNIAVHRVLRLQAQVAVFHAGAVAIDGAGVLLAGPKGSGKTTLSLALAARGHGFLADEMAALRLDTMELVPLRRSVSIRPGPGSPRVDAAVRAAGLSQEEFLDGPRVRAAIDQLFPGNVGATVPLGAIVFLRQFRSTPHAERMAPRREHLGLLAALPSTLWEQPAPVRAIRLLGILSKARCFRLDVGDPDETAALVEKTVQGSWD